MALKRMTLWGQSIMVDDENGRVGVVLADSSGVAVSPATEEKQNTLIAATAAYTTGAPGALNVTGTSAALGAQACRSVVLTAHKDNADYLWIGIGATAVLDQGIQLAAGDRVSVSVSNLNMVNAIASSSGDDLLFNWVN